MAQVPSTAAPASANPLSHGRSSTIPTQLLVIGDGALSVRCRCPGFMRAEVNVRKGLTPVLAGRYQMLDFDH